MLTVCKHWLSIEHFLAMSGHYWCIPRKSVCLATNRLSVAMSTANRSMKHVSYKLNNYSSWAIICKAAVTCRASISCYKIQYNIEPDRSLHFALKKVIMGSIKIFTILLATFAFGFVQTRFSCDDGLFMVFSYFRHHYETILPTVIPKEMQIFICQHMAFHYFTNSTGMHQIPTMNSTINSLCHLWVSRKYFRLASKYNRNLGVS